MSAALPNELEAIERSLFDAVLAIRSQHDGNADVETVFVLGAPRTGSTLMYQAVCSRFGLPYVANITNDRFSSTPIVGFALQKALPVDVAFDSRFGKTDGPFQPSEGSGLMVHWFGSGDPPALKAATIRAGFEQHFVDTLRAVAALFAAPVVIKNAWNCFRIPCLARTLPKARFIWIRRDIADAAKSDLDARYKTKGDATSWNSALPPDVAKLRKMPPAIQVVENQHAFNQAIRDGLERFASDRWVAIWHESFQRDPDTELKRVGALISRAPRADAPKIRFAPNGRWSIDHSEERAIDEYLDRNSERFAGDRLPTSG
jgi:hypothetical protein